jgi:hypothetical protein
VTQIRKSISVEFFNRTTRKELFEALASVPDSAGIAFSAVENRDPREPQGTRLTITAAWSEGA